MKKTVIYYGSFALPDLNAAAHRVVSVGKILRSLGYNVVFLGGNPENGSFEGIRSVKNPYDFEMFEEEYPIGTVQWVKWLVNINNLKALIEKYPDTAAVILYNSPYTIVNLAKKLVKGKNIKLIYDHPEWCDVTEGPLPKRMVKKTDTDLVKKFMPAKVDGLIVISSFMENYYRSFNKPMVRLTPMVDTDDEIWHNPPFKAQHRISFCFAGTIDASKDYLNVIVEAFTKIKNSDIGLEVVGVAEQDFKQKYPQILPDDGSGNITFYGRLSHTETVRHILGTDYYIFIRPSDTRNNAGFPTKFTEAATSGTPVITTNVSDVGEYVGKSVKGYIAKDTDVGTIVGAIKKAAAEFNPATREQKQLCEVFDYRSSIKRVDKWLKQII